MALFGLFNRSPLTLRELVNVDEGRKERSLSQSVTLDKIYHKIRKETVWDRIKSIFKRSNSTLNMYYVVLRFNVSSSSGNIYTVLIEFQPNPDLNSLMSNKVKVYCECLSFKYQSAYYLNKRGNLYRSSSTDTELDKALTEAPDPKKTHVSPCCKHVFACINWIDKNIDYLIRNI